MADKAAKKVLAGKLLDLLQEVFALQDQDVTGDRDLEEAVLHLQTLIVLLDPETPVMGA